MAEEIDCVSGCVGVWVSTFLFLCVVQGECRLGVETNRRFACKGPMKLSRLTFIERCVTSRAVNGSPLCWRIKYGIRSVKGAKELGILWS